jgi:hypothetical protein
MSTPARRGRQFPVDDAEVGGAGRFVGEHRAGLAATAVVVAALALAWAVWTRVADTARARADAVLRPEAVELIGQAPWVRCDLREEALRNASLDGGLPLDDPELPRRLARAFDMHPWVSRVVAVKLRHPAAATVEVACREPVAMVAVKGGLLAVDAEGVVLPSADFSAESAARYPRITGVNSSPQGPEGSSWGDPVVEEAAAVAVAIGPEWEPLGLTECRPVVGVGPRKWELVGPSTRSILFGSAPGREPAGEPSAAAKLARLRRLAAQPAAEGKVDLTTPAQGEDGEAAATAPRPVATAGGSP